MKKPLIWWAVLANILLLTPCSGQNKATSSASATSSVSTSSSSASTSSQSTSIVTSNKNKPCNDDGCGWNERMVDCPFGVCAPKTCDDVGFPVACPDLLPNEPCPDGPDCICIENYVRNKKGICIPMKQCPSCGGDKNAVSGCGCNCNTCSNYNNTTTQCECPDECMYNACECRRGFIFDEIKGKCVKPEDCSKLKCEKANEVYDPCPAPCPLRTCGINDAAVDCVPALSPGDPECAPPKCRCKDGFYRDDKGECVTLDECPTCPGDNEIYDPCPAPCPPQRCDVDPAVILCLVPPQVGDPECEPGCRCIDGYVRNYTGNVCIRREDCPQCPQNEIYDICDAPCPPRRCDVDERLIKCAAPPKPGDSNCVEGCRCVDGYKRDSNGDCIPAEDCPKCTNPNEVYDPCPPTCPPPATCESINKTYHCPNQPVGDDGEIIQTCEGQCVCQPGYYRNKIGDCISEENCLKCTGPNEFFSCGSACDNVCGLLDKQNQTNCPIINIKCNDKCYCDDGYARDENNICIPIEDCDVPKCRKYERYDPCPAYLCQPLNCSQLGYPVACPSYPDSAKCPGNPGCVCIDGYVRDDRTGQCIRKELCPSCGGDKNATSGCGVNCNKTCRDVGKKSGTCIEICYDNECDCKDGYYLDENTDQCVKPEDCSPVCPINEIYSECVQALCSPKKCSELGFRVRCPRIDPKFCKKGCVCRDGKVRNSKGICVDKSECPSCGGDSNAQSGCGLYCNRRCSNIGQEPEVCVDLCYDNACDCKEGYYLDEDSKKCVLPEDCQQPICNKNEYFNNCSNYDCSPQNCNDLGFPIQCNEVEDPSQCTEDCLCKPDYVRNNKDICIPSRECPSCGGDPNAVSGCGGYCNRKCSNIGNEQEACILICRINACDCREGYYFDEVKQLCVLPEDCTPQCPENEYYSTCTNGDCSVQNCTDVGLPISCARIDPEYCKEGCLCIDGYARNEKGICVPKNECPTCKGDPNQISGCGVYCNQKCSDIGKESGPCILICYENSCNCREGYYLDESTGRCVEPSKCPPVCGDNEVYSECINGGCEAKKCSQLGKDVACVKLDPASCIKGCLCKKGYLRDKNGICVPESECNPKLCPRPNEEYNSCFYNCPPQTCESLDKVYACPIREGDTCKAQCVCKTGYYRNKIGECISEADCRKCMGPNEYFTCGGACDNVCATIKKQNQTNCPIVNVKCNDMCYCEKNYARAANKTCIPIDKCNEPQCGVNEKYEKCPQKLRGPFTCAQLGFPVKDNSKKKCGKPACVCVDGYVRDSNKVCIPKTDCPSCGGDENAVSGCGNCIDLCEDLGSDDPRICTQICKENACDCRDGFYYEKTLKKCVPPEQCTSICDDVNEYFENCTNPRCRANTCDELGFPLNCSTDSSDCKKGCYCNDDFVRNKDGKCVPVRDCPSCGGDVNAQSGCGVNCLKNCYDLANPKRPRPCPRICNVNGCDCKDGFYLDENTGQCVKPEECSPQCPENEYYSTCTNGDCSVQNCTDVGLPISCARIDPEYCKKGCLCNDGYARNEKGICVPKNECPTCKGDPNQISGCGVYCNQKCSDIGKESGPCILICYENSCNCREGYYLDESTGRCVEPSKCPPQCPENEYYSNCINGDCSVQNCADVGLPINCPRIKPKYCKKGCLCNEGYARNANGTCVPLRECPTCKGDLNRVSGCGIYCNQRCSDIGLEQGACIDVCYENECECREGYYLDTKTDKCVLPNDCTSCKNDPNRVPGCGVYCNQRCADIGKEPGVCIAVCYDNACNCKKGYFLDENIDKCVKPNDCTPVCGDNEVYSECINGGCEAKNCSQLGKDVACVKLDPASCIEGCLCKKGYLRDKNGICVPESECNPKLCPRPNEEYNSCFYNCPPQTCESLDKVYACPIREGDTCKAQCVCKTGYYRNKIGECISEADCRKCMGPNEYFTCGGACDNVCATIKKQNQTNCPIVNVKCNDMCYCEKNYARAANKTCIPIDKCNEPQCGVNEKYEKCPQKLRGPFTCAQLGFPVKDNSKKKCGKPACVCVDGYVRDSNKVCIPKTDCPSCGGDENAVSGCGNCIALCEDLGSDDPRFCTEICNENACDCRDGFYYDKTLKKCVPPEQCSSICDDVNEYFENCMNPRCRANTCDELGFPLNCSTDSSDCKKGCYCNDDFVRNKDGKCIPVRDCPSCGGDVNAQSGCGVNCLKHCYDLANPKSPKPCPKICNVNACDCKDGFYLDENTGQCVKPEECSPICGKDEVYDPCTNGGCEFRNCSQLGGPQICIDPIKCIKGCKCKQDYLRAKNGTCIPIEKCPEAKCPKRERFEKCPAALCLPLTCDDFGIDIPCPPTDGGFCPGGPGCICEDGLVRNKRGKCIHKRKCPSCGGDPNAWSGCGVNCGKRCDDVFNKTRPCPRICYPNSCDCKDGFYFNEITGKCVKPSECPPPCPENEQRDFCVNGYCGIRNCSQANGPILCVDPIECRVGCTCVDGYLREDDTGVCVPECECPVPPEKCNAPKCVTCIDCTEGPPVNETTAVANFELGNDLLNREFLYQLVKGRPGESFMFSAFSVLIALAQLTLYAVRTALDQLLRLLNLKSKDEIRTVFPILIKNYETQESVIFKLAIKYYGSIKHPFTKKFIEESAVIFKSKGQSINFAENVEAADTINDWVRNQTNNLIDNLVDPSMLSEQTRMVLVNALYFLGDWVYPFDPNETTPKNFYYGTSDSDVLSLPTMCQQKRFLYAESEDLDCQILRLPYKGQNFTFDIYLPRTRDGLGLMVDKMRNTDNIFTKTQELLEYQTVRACIPKMDIATDISNLSELLQMANLTAPFDPNSDGFECIFEDEFSVFISDAIQKSRIKVDETGTEAAVATGVVVGVTSVQQPPRIYNFIVDHPCAFFIFNKNMMVFAGVFTGK